MFSKFFNHFRIKKRVEEIHFEIYLLKPLLRMSSEQDIF